MTKYFTLLILLFSAHFVVGQDHLASVYTDIVFVDACNVRESPSLSAKVLGQLRHGTRVEFCSSWDKEDEIDEVKGYWASIMYKNRYGYIWQPNLAHGHFKSHVDTDIEFLIHYNAKDKIEFKVFKGGLLLEQAEFDRPELKHLNGSVTFGRTYNSRASEVIAIAYNDSLYELFEWKGFKLSPSKLKLRDESLLTRKFSEYEYGFINAEGVNLRAGADSAAPILKKLHRRAKLKIALADSQYMQDLNFWGSWIRVEWKDSFAYVWSKYIDIPRKYIKSNKNKNEAFLHTTGGIYVLQKDLVVAHLPHEDYDVSRGENFVNFGSRGLDKKYQILGVCIYSYSCGQSSGDLLYVWDGKDLKFLYFDGGIGDGGISEYFGLKFPSDFGGQKGKIIKYDAYSEPDDFMLDQSCARYGSAFITEIYSVMEYNGDTLVEVDSKHKRLKDLVSSNFQDSRLMHYQFFDGNNDGIEDVIFLLNKGVNDENGSPIGLVGIAHGKSDMTFDTPIVNRSIVHEGYFNVEFNPGSDSVAITIKYNTGMYGDPIVGGFYNLYVFFYDKSRNMWLWRSIESAETFRRDEPTFTNVKKAYFRKKLIPFEKAW